MESHQDYERLLGESHSETWKPLDVRTVSLWAQVGVCLIVFGIMGCVAIRILPAYMPVIGDIGSLGDFGAAAATIGGCMIAAAAIRYYALAVPPRWYIRAGIETAFNGRRWLHYDRRQWAGKLVYHLPVKINQRKGYAEQQFWLHDSRAGVDEMQEALRTIRRVQDVDIEPVTDRNGRVKWMRARLWFVTREEAYSRE